MSRQSGDKTTEENYFETFFIAGLKEIYDMQQELAESYESVSSCEKGCSYCCYQMTAILTPEAMYLANEILKRPDWQTITRRLQKNARKNDGRRDNRAEYFSRGIPCPLLDTGAGTCMLYHARPAACRYMYVVTPKEDCRFDGGAKEISCHDLSDLEASVWKYSAVREPLNSMPITAPLSIFVLHAMEEVSEVTSSLKHKFVRKIAATVQDPIEWVQGALANDNMLGEDTISAKKSILRASMKAGLL